jgi:hypothetical protein
MSQSPASLVVNRNAVGWPALYCMNVKQNEMQFWVIAHLIDSVSGKFDQTSKPTKVAVR